MKQSVVAKAVMEYLYGDSERSQASETLIDRFSRVFSVKTNQEGRISSIGLSEEIARAHPNLARLLNFDEISTRFSGKEFNESFCLEFVRFIMGIVRTPLEKINTARTDTEEQGKAAEEIRRIAIEMTQVLIENRLLSEATQPEMASGKNGARSMAKSKLNALIKRVRAQGILCIDENGNLVPLESIDYNFEISVAATDSGIILEGNLNAAERERNGLDNRKIPFGLVKQIEDSQAGTNESERPETSAGAQAKTVTFWEFYSKHRENDKFLVKAAGFLTKRNTSLGETFSRYLALQKMIEVASSGGVAGCDISVFEIIDGKISFNPQSIVQQEANMREESKKGQEKSAEQKKSINLAYEKSALVQRVNSLIGEIKVLEGGALSPDSYGELAKVWIEVEKLEREGKMLRLRILGRERETLLKSFRRVYEKVKPPCARKVIKNGKVAVWAAEKAEAVSSWEDPSFREFVYYAVLRELLDSLVYDRRLLERAVSDERMRAASGKRKETRQTQPTKKEKGEKKAKRPKKAEKPRKLSLERLEKIRTTLKQARFIQSYSKIDVDTFEKSQDGIDSPPSSGQNQIEAVSKRGIRISRAKALVYEDVSKLDLYEENLKRFVLHPNDREKVSEAFRDLGIQNFDPDFITAWDFYSNQVLEAVDSLIPESEKHGKRKKKKPEVAVKEEPEAVEKGGIEKALREINKAEITAKKVEMQDGRVMQVSKEERIRSDFASLWKRMNKYIREAPKKVPDDALGIEEEVSHMHDHLINEDWGEIVEEVIITAEVVEQIATDLERLLGIDKIVTEKALSGEKTGDEALRAVSFLIVVRQKLVLMLDSQEQKSSKDQQNPKPKKPVGDENGQCLKKVD